MSQSFNGQQGATPFIGKRLILFCSQIGFEEECGAATAASRLLRSPVVCLQTLANCSLSSNQSEKHKLETAHFQSKS